MTDLGLAREGLVRHWLVDAVLGGAVALVVITAAHASLPRAEPRSPPPAAARPVAAVAQKPSVLIAFRDPVPGREVVSPFGLRQMPWEENGRLHAGVDISGVPGEPVLAAADGVVVDSGRSPTYGQFVAVRHAEGLISFYAHLGSIQGRIAPGLALKAGEALGRVGSTGTSTGPHLHFEIRDRRDRPLNPTYFLGKAFAEADDLPLRRAQWFGRRVRMAEVSTIPKSKRELMLAKLKRETADKALKQARLQAKALKPAAEPALAGTTSGPVSEPAQQPAGPIEGLKLLSIDENGRPRAKLTL